jgi:hypothetical protein
MMNRRNVMAWTLKKFYEQFWGKPLDKDTEEGKRIMARNKVVQKAGEEFQRQIYDPKLMRDFIVGVTTLSKNKGVDPKYIFFLIFKKVEDWPPLPEYLERSLETMDMIFRDQGKVPKSSNYRKPPPEKMKDVVTIIRGAGVIGGRYMEVLKNRYLRINKSFAGEIIPHLKEEDIDRQQAAAVLCTLLEKAILKYRNWFDKPYTMRKVMVVFRLDTPNICML